MSKMCQPFLQDTQEAANPAMQTQQSDIITALKQARYAMAIKKGNR